MRPRALTHSGTVISLLTPTQDLVFAQKAITVNAVGGGFRDLTVAKGSRCQSTRGWRELASSCSDIPCNPR